MMMVIITALKADVLAIYAYLLRHRMQLSEINTHVITKITYKEYLHWHVFLH